MKQVNWTPEAEDKFEDILEYLRSNWTERDVENFLEATDRVIAYIAKQPKMFRKTNLRNVHEALVTPHNLLVYKVYPTRIDIITFWDTRQNPFKRTLK